MKKAACSRPRAYPARVAFWPSLSRQAFSDQGSATLTPGPRRRPEIRDPARPALSHPAASRGLQAAWLLGNSPLRVPSLGGFLPIMARAQVGTPYFCVGALGALMVR